MASGNFLRIWDSSLNGGDGGYAPITDPKFGAGTFTLTTNVSEARNARGDFVGAVVGDDKYKVELSWDIISAEEYKALCGYFDRTNANGGSRGKFVNTFQVFDPRTNALRSGVKMYVSDRTGTPLMVINGEAKWISNARIALVEV